MHSKIRDNKFLGFVGLGILAALAPLACGSDDGDQGGTNTGGSSAGKAGSSAGKSGSGGQSSGGTGSNSAGEDNKSGSDAAGGAGGAPIATARLRLVHASPGAPSVDIYPKDSTDAAAENVGYGDATDFIEVPAGPVAFDLRLAGADSDAPAPFTTDSVELAADADYTFVAAGDFAQAADPDVGFRFLALQHDFEPATDGQALARVVHATPAWASVDIDVVATAGVDLPGLAAFDTESNVPLPAGVTLDVAFQTDADGTLSKLTLPEFDEGGELFIIATGNPGLPFRPPANGFALLVVDQNGKVSWVRENPRLHLLHASDIPTVDVYESTHTDAADKLSDDLAAQGLDVFQLPASEDGFTLKAVAEAAPSGTATGLASGDTGALEAGEHYLSYIAGDTVRTVHEQFDLEQPTKVLLRGVHGSTVITETVDFGVASSGSLNSPLISAVAPGMASAEAGVAINPGTVIMGAAETETLTPLFAEKSFTGDAKFVAGERGFLLLNGENELWFVDTSSVNWSVR